jgi:hypothetical protein
LFEPAFLGKATLAQPGAYAHAPPGAGRAWWKHHIMNTRAYLEATLAGDSAGALAALKELWQGVLDWQRITGSWAEGLLIAEHTALAKLLIDCAVKNNDACIGAAADALGRNVAAQSGLFPRDPAGFVELFDLHVKITGQYITDLAQGRRSDFDTDFSSALQNGNDLGDFTDRMFLGIFR